MVQTGNLSGELERGGGRKEMVKGDMDIEDHIFLCKNPVEPGELAFK